MLEALSEIKRNTEQYKSATDNYSDGMYWARPIEWRTFRTAYCYRVGSEIFAEGFEMVPNNRGGVGAMFPATYALFGEWEIVSPNTVNSGR